MAVFSFPAVAIFDSTTIGRSLITAANQAAAQAAIGIDPADYAQLDSDNTWTGDNTFDEPISAGDGSVTAPSYSFGSQSTMGIYRAATNQINMICASGGKGLNLQTSSLSISSDLAFGWRSVPNISQGHSFDTLLARDATGIIAQRNFFNNAPQAYRVYGTYTDASNGEWLQMDHGVTNSTRSTIASMANGTGIARTIDISCGTSVRFKGDSAFSYIYGSSGGYIFYGANKLRGQSGISIDIGESTNRFANVYSVDGDFSGDVTIGGRVLAPAGDNAIAFGVDGGTTTLVSASNGTYFLGDLYAGVDDTYNLGTPTFYWSNVYSKDGTFSGRVLTDRLENQAGYSYIRVSAGTSGVIRFWRNFEPQLNDSFNSGNIALRWANNYSVDGSFSNNLNVETGGSFKFYNLGDSHTNTTNTESMSLYSTSNVNYFYSAATGSGTVRDLRIGSASNNIWFRNAFGAYIFTAGGSGKLEITSAGVILQSDLFPWPDGTEVCGKTDHRWLSVNSVNADFSGTTKLSSNDDGAGNSGHLSIEPLGDDYLIKANSLGTTADASIKIQTSQTSASGTESVIFDADYSGRVSFYFGGNHRGYWDRAILQANVQVATNTNFVINRTWNNAATVFQGFDANITDTASDVNSNLLNLKVGGVQKFRVKKDGTCTATSFVGNGSGLTGVSVDTGDDYMWTGDNEFDGDVIMVGSINFDNLPTSDPNVSGRLYNDSGTVKISSGGAPPP